MKKRKNRTSKHLQNQILAMTLIFTLIIGGIVAVMSSWLYRHYLLNSLLQTTDINLQFLTDSVESNMANVEKLMRMAQANTTIGEYVSSRTQNNTLTIKAYERLYEEYQNTDPQSYMHRVVIANTNLNKFLQIVNASYSSSDNIALEAPKLPYFNQLLNAKDYDFTTGFTNDPFYNGSAAPQVLPIVRPIYSRYNAQSTGWVFVFVSEKLFTDPLQYYSMSSDSRLYLTVGEHTYEMSPNGLRLLLPDTHITKPLKTDILSPNAQSCYIEDHATGQEHLIITHPLDLEGCYITQTISPGELNSQRTLFGTMVCIIMLLVTVLGFVLSYLLYRTINLPVLRIRNRLSSISTGDFSRDSSIEWKHELGDIGRGINDLAENISKLLEDRIADEKQKKDLEYKMLQSQINPHFLYNTLNSIKWMATIQGADGISEMTTALSRLLKSISKGTKLLIPIRDELELLQDYFTIQKYRYGGTIALDIKVSDETLFDCQIIKFTLQPIVENAIFHGIEPKGCAGHILITADYTENRDICIVVEDDGVGMSEETVSKLLTDTSDNRSEFFREIGVNNVHKRLQYEFGDEYGISIESKVGEYTKMKILLPAKHAE